MNKEFIDQYFINPSPAIGFDTYLIRQSIMKAVTDLQGKIHGNVTDLGCGIMPYKEYLRAGNKIDNYTGIDLDNSSYHNVVKPDKYWDGITIPLEDSTQDWVIITEFLEHYFDTQHILAEIKRVLKPGGSVFFTVPFVYMLHEVPYDHNRFTPFSLSTHLKNAGFINNEVFPLGGFNYSLMIMMSLWCSHSGTRRWPRVLAKGFLKLFYKHLQKTDNGYSTYQKNYTGYENATYPSGLWGYGTK